MATLQQLVTKGLEVSGQTLEECEICQWMISKNVTTLRELFEAAQNFQNERRTMLFWLWVRTYLGEFMTADQRRNFTRAALRERRVAKLMLAYHEAGRALLDLDDTEKQELRDA